MLEPMTPSGCSAEQVRKQLERVLASPGFARNERLSRFLRVIVERHLEGREGDLKESVIGIEVFRRQPGFDAKQDSTVRTEAGRLRARLAEYYAGDGLRDRVIIELPKGGYIPVFRQSMASAKDRIWYRRPWLRGALAVLAVAVAAAGWWWVQHRRAPITIAVLPLTDLSAGPSNAYFADGLTDEIIRDLSIIDGLAVRSHTSSFVFKGKPRKVREAGEQLQADYILEGSVLRTGQKLRIIAQLVRARDDFSLWSGRFDRELTDVVAIQDDISRGIVNSLRLKLGRGRRRYETSVEAYDLYLRDRSLLPPVGQLPPGVRRNNPIPFQDVIAKDPAFAPAYAGLAEAYSTLASIAGAEPDNLVKMREMAERAIQLDPLLEEAHDALGVVYARDGQWTQAEASFRRAIELNPNSELTRVNYVTSLLWPLGRIDEALQQLRAAERSGPAVADLALCVRRRADLGWPVQGRVCTLREVVGHRRMSRSRIARRRENRRCDYDSGISPKYAVSGLRVRTRRTSPGSRGPGSRFPGRPPAGLDLCRLGGQGRHYQCFTAHFRVGPGSRRFNAFAP
jgi:TolB-like protein